MSASIRGHMGQLKLFKDGQLQNLVDFTSVEVNMDSTFSRTNYVGRAVPEGDQSIEGFSGTAELEVKDSSVDDLINALINDNLNGIGVSDYSFQISESYPDGQVKTHVYFDVQWKMSRRQGGQTDKITKRLEFQCSGRLAV